MRKELAMTKHTLYQSPAIAQSRGGVYLITCKMTGITYCGSTSCLNGRYKTHLNNLRSGSHENKAMLSDFRRYGEDSFEFIVLCRLQRRAHRLAVESMIISYLKEKKISYNRNGIIITKMQEERYAIPDEVMAMLPSAH
jgi:group I intron endonuclease